MIDYTAVVFCLFVVAVVLWLVWPLRHTPIPSNIEVEMVDCDLVFDPEYRCGTKDCPACERMDAIARAASSAQKDELGSE